MIASSRLGCHGQGAKCKRYLQFQSDLNSNKKLFFMSLRLDRLQVCQSCKLTRRLDLTVFSTSDPLSAYTSHIN